MTLRDRDDDDDDDDVVVVVVAVVAQRSVSRSEISVFSVLRFPDISKLAHF